jgi:glutamate synthase (NADPH/NADH) small chain
LLADGAVAGLVCARTAINANRRAVVVPETEFTVAADQVVKAIGQQKPSLTVLLGLKSDGQHIAVDEEMQTSIPGVYAGGDAIRAVGSCSTVMAVQDGKLAARAIHRALSSN